MLLLLTLSTVCIHPSALCRLTHMLVRASIQTHHLMLHVPSRKEEAQNGSNTGSKGAHQDLHSCRAYLARVNCSS